MTYTTEVNEIIKHLAAIFNNDFSVFADAAISADADGRAAFWFTTGAYDQIMLNAVAIANGASLSEALQQVANQKHPYADGVYALDRLIPLNPSAVREMAAAYGDLGITGEPCGLRLMTAARGAYDDGEAIEVLHKRVAERRARYATA